MGLDLTLLPVEAEFSDWGFAHTVLDLERRRDLFNEVLGIEEHESLPVPGYFTTYLCRDDRYEETHYGDTQETPYGAPLRCVQIEHLLKIREHPGVQDTAKNRAAWAYLASLPPEHKVALYWH